ncbi:MAG: site-specific integrase, partial [Candidatus Methanomethyliaceae archaeon]|nr:site-specific integrase [Candidatus Methanomethyliaceae archaeon]
MKVYFGKYLGVDVMDDFRVPSVSAIPKSIPSKKDLQRFFGALETNRDRALFLLFATSGLRRHEVFSLKIQNIDFKMRAVLPSTHGSTKRAWASFFNQEAEFYLTLYLSEARLKPNSYLFKERLSKKIWYHAREKTGLDITPQVLREWFAEEMARLGVPDRFIDAFQGRIPRSVLARHYTDYSLD